MNLKKLAAASLLATMLGGTATVVTAAAAHAGTAPAPSTTCLPGNHDDTWPAWANGQPARSPGVTVWHDIRGWHVRVTHNALRDRTYSGEIATKGELVNVMGVKLEKNDYVRVGANKHTIVFRFNNYGHVDGFDFKTHCAPALAFGFLSDGHRVAPARISIGAGRHHPASNPFLIKRTA